METHYYHAQVGTAEITFYGNCDRRATVKVGRWIRRHWSAYKARNMPGRLGHEIDHNNPEVRITRRYVNDIGVVQCHDPVEVHSFILNDETFKEFSRTYL